MGDAFEEIDEEKYKELVKQRRNENFVEDDGSYAEVCSCHTDPTYHSGENEAAAGYVDYGEEEDWATSNYMVCPRAGLSQFG